MLTAPAARRGSAATFPQKKTLSLPTDLSSWLLGGVGGGQSLGSCGFEKKSLVSACNSGGCDWAGAGFGSLGATEARLLFLSPTWGGMST